MKKYFGLIVLFLLVQELLIAQMSPPHKLETSLLRKFPKAEDQKWSETESNWKVEFIQEGQFHKVEFDTKDHFKVIEIELDEDDIPAKIQKTLKKKIPKAYLEHIVFRSEVRAGKYYQILAETDSAKIEIKFSNRGRILQWKESRH